MGFFSILTCVKNNNLFKIPNLEVLADWAGWVVGYSKSSAERILEAGLKGPVSTFIADWPEFMQREFDPKSVANQHGHARDHANDHENSDSAYRVWFYGLLQLRRARGWKVDIKARRGTSFVDIKLRHEIDGMAVLIELDPTNNPLDLEDSPLINHSNLNTKDFEKMHTLRKYRIAGSHLDSVDGRYLELEGQHWVVKKDPQSD